MTWLLLVALVHWPVPRPLCDDGCPCTDGVRARCALHRLMLLDDGAREIVL